MDTVVNYEGSGACIIGLVDEVYTIFILDFAASASASTNTGGYTEIRIADRQILLCFCVLGASLFMFDVSLTDEEKSTYMLDLDEYLCLGSVVLHLSELHHKYKAPSMKFEKFRPAAIPTPDGKILVFSSLFVYNPLGLWDRFDFEVFDPSNNTWTQIPQPLVFFNPGTGTTSSSISILDDKSGKRTTYSCEEFETSDYFLIHPVFIDCNTFCFEFPIGVMCTYNFESGWKYQGSNDSKVGCHQQWQEQDTLLLGGLRMDPCSISNGAVKHDFPIPRLSDKSPNIVLLRNLVM